jgi:hypothetical protein
MKAITQLLLLVILMGCNAKPYIPVPMRTLDDVLTKDKGTSWVKISQTRNSNFLEDVYTLEGDSLGNWNELYFRQFRPKGFNEVKVDIDTFIKNWNAEIDDKQGVKFVTNETLGENAYYFQYEIKDENVYAIWVFFKGLDGIYLQGWQCKSKGKNDTRISTWKRILRDSDTSINGKMEAF